MKFVDIEIFPIAQTGLNTASVADWMERMGAHEFQLPNPFDVDDAESLIGMAGKRCYASFQPGLNPNVTKVRSDWHEYLENILKSGHGSVLEHATVTFAIEGLTRVATAELNRHRAGVAISEASLRYIRFHDKEAGGIPFWIPSSLRPADQNVSEKIGEEMGVFNHREEQKAETRRVFESVITHIEEQYSHLVNNVWKVDQMTNFDEKKRVTSMLRRIIPLGVSVGGVWTFNFRALRHIIALRSTPHAEEEIAYIAGLIGRYMVENFASTFADFTEGEGGFLVPKYPKV